MIFLTWTVIGECREQWDIIELVHPEIAEKMLIFGDIGVPTYAFIWILITLIGNLASIILRYGFH